MIGVNPGLPVFFCAFPSVPIVRVESSRFTQRGFIVSATGEIIGIRKKSLCGQRRAFILIVDPVSASKVRRYIPQISRTSIQDWLKGLKRWAFLITNVSRILVVSPGVWNRVVQRRFLGRQFSLDASCLRRIPTNCKRQTFSHTGRFRH